MALATQVLDIPLAGSLDTKLAKELLPNGRLSKLENFVQRETGVIAKRPDYTSLTQAIIDSASTVGAGVGLFSTPQDELLLADGTNLYSYIENHGWADRGKFSTIDVNAFVAAGNAGWLGLSRDSAVSPDNAYVCSSYANFDTGIFLSVHEVATGHLVFEHQISSATGAYQRIVACTSGFVCVGPSSGDIDVITIDYADWSVTESAGLLSDFDAGSDAIDVIAYETEGDEWVVAYTDNANDFQIAVYSYALVQQHSASDTARQASDIALVEGASGDIVVFLRDTASNDTQFCRYDSSLSGSFAQLMNDEADSVVAVRTDASDNTRIFYVSSGGGGVETRTVDSSGTASSATEIARGVYIASKPVVYESVSYLALHFRDYTTVSSIVQTTLMLVDEDGQIQARYFAGEGPAGYDDKRTTLNQYGSGKFLMLDQRRSRVSSSNNTVNVDTAENVVVKFDFNGAISHASSKGLEMLASGLVNSYDGKNVSDLGFGVYPNTNTIGLTAKSASGSLSEGTYGVRVTYWFQDARGKDHESTPSVAETVDVSSPNDAIDVTVPNLGITNKRNVQIRVWRTIANGSVYYLDKTVDNDPTTDSQTVTLDDADSDTSDNTRLYTTGGVVVNSPPPAPYFVGADGSRVWVVSAEKRKELWYSKLLNEKYAAPEFNDTFVRRVPEGGDATAVGFMDGRVIVFKKDEIRHFSGAGPNNVGQGSFSEDAVADPSVGCVDRNSVVRIPAGLMFKSPRGIYLLNRSLQASYIGAGVEDYNDTAVVRAVRDNKRQEVYFLLEDSTLLVYDYQHSAWSTFDGVTAVDATVWDDKLHLLQADGVVKQEGTTFTSVRGTVRTGWIRLGALQGFQRVRRANLTGRRTSSTTLKFSVYVDYDDSAPVQTESISLDATAGEMTAELHMSRQKCSAVMIQVEDTAGTGQIELLALSLTIGRKRRSRPLSPSLRV